MSDGVNVFLGLKLTTPCRADAYLSSDSGSSVLRLWMWLTGELVFSSLLME